MKMAGIAPTPIGWERLEGKHGRIIIGKDEDDGETTNVVMFVSYEQDYLVLDEFKTRKP